VAASIGLPYPPYLRKVIRRGAEMWVLLRCAYVIIMMGAASARLISSPEAVAAALHPYGSTRVVLVALAAFFVWWGRRRSRETLLPANLGTRPSWFWGSSLLGAAGMDLVVQTVLGTI
jgi:hypothetical protein